MTRLLVAITCTALVVVYALATAYDHTFNRRSLKRDNLGAE